VKQKISRGCAAAAALGLLVWSSTPGAAAGAAKPATHTVVMQAVGFQPVALTVAAGDAIVWVNKDPFPHTATSKAGGFDSGTIDAGKSWKVTVRKKGEFGYVCTLHPTMKGTLRVK
jgi:plastocyanin